MLNLKNGSSSVMFFGHFGLVSVSNQAKRTINLKALSTTSENSTKDDVSGLFKGGLFGGKGLHY